MPRSKLSLSRQISLRGEVHPQGTVLGTCDGLGADDAIKAIQGRDHEKVVSKSKLEKGFTANDLIKAIQTIAIAVDDLIDDDRNDEDEPKKAARKPRSRKTKTKEE